MTKIQSDTIKKLRQEILTYKKLNRPFSINSLNLLHDGLCDTLIRLKSKQIKESSDYYHKIYQLKARIEKRLEMGSFSEVNK